MRPIVHIGYHKTATSWFQKKVYPLASSHTFVDRVRVREELHGGTAFDFDPDGARSRLLEGWEDGRQPIICEEDLCGYPHHGIISGYFAKEVALRLAAMFPLAQIVIFVRAQPSMALSSYDQYVREGGTDSARQYLFPDSWLTPGNSRPLKVPRFNFAHLDYRGLISHYDELFGSNNVHVFAFEELSRDPEAMLRRMSEVLGLELDRSGISFGRVNRSYRPWLLPLARFLNLFTAQSVGRKRWLLHVPYWYSARKALLRGLNRVGRAKPHSPEDVLGPEVVRWIEHRFVECNRWLSQRMNTDLRALGYVLDAPPAPAEFAARGILPHWIAN